MSTNDPARRGFLRNLMSLPLIGGGVTLIGSPTAAAVPVSEDLLNSYETWLDSERTWLRWERYGKHFRNVPNRTGVEAIFRNTHTGQLFDYVRLDNAGACFSHDRPMPSARAAVVLATVGCDWTEEA